MGCVIYSLLPPKKVPTPYVIPKHLEAFDLSQFENVAFTSSMPDAGADFTAGNCIELAKQFAMSLEANINSREAMGPEFVWDSHLDHVNILSREIHARNLACTSEVLMPNIVEGLSAGFKSRIHLLLSGSGSRIVGFSSWTALLQGLIVSVIPES